MCNNSDDGFTGYEVVFGGFACLMIALLMFIIYAFYPSPNKGYGGSPGHMSPMEVEALYEKNKKP